MKGKRKKFSPRLGIGSPERVGFRRSDERHPNHANHSTACHSGNVCDCAMQRRAAVATRSHGEQL